VLSGMHISVWRLHILQVGCLAAVVGICIVGVVQGAEANDIECREVREFSGVNYWFWQGYLGVADVIDNGVALTGRLSHEPGICFQVLRSELHEPFVRTRGYKLAVLEWFKRLPIEPEQWETDPAGRTAQQHLRILTRQDFSSREQWTRWWVENNDYLLWSDAAGHLIVDEKAKLAKSPIAEEIGEITATQYWFWQARDWLKDTREDGAFIRGQGWTEHGYQKFRIPKGALTDRTAKEEGYKEAVKGYILGGVALPELKDAALEQFMARLRDLTGESYQKREEWVEWWNEHKDHLVLSTDGQRLVAEAR